LDENLLKVVALVLFIPAIGGAVAYLMGHPSLAMVLNGVVPLLVLVVSALAMLNNPPTEINLGAALYFVFPVAVLLACGAGLRARRLHPALFWFSWAVNLATAAFLFYLAFLFKIF
jgi:hypothetical protein